MNSPDSNVGRAQACPECGQANTVPAPEPAVAAPRPTEVDVPAELREINQTLTKFVNDRYEQAHRQVKIPDYTAVGILAVIFQILGTLAMGFAAILGLLCLLAAVGNGSFSPRLGGFAFFGLWPAACAFLYGLILFFAMGQMFSCIRDLARNSFHLRRL